MPALLLAFRLLIAPSPPFFFSLGQHVLFPPTSPSHRRPHIFTFIFHHSRFRTPWVLKRRRSVQAAVQAPHLPASSVLSGTSLGRLSVRALATLSLTRVTSHHQWRSVHGAYNLPQWDGQTPSSVHHQTNPRGCRCAFPKQNTAFDPTCPFITAVIIFSPTLLPSSWRRPSDR